MTQTRLSSNARLICALATFAAFGLQGLASAQPSVPRGPSQTQPRLRLTQPRIQVTGAQPDITPAGERITHVVQRGETLSSISRRYGTSVAAVQRWNGLRGTVIRIGTRLTIFTAGGAAGPPVTTARGDQVTHVVRSGETLSSISRRYGTSVAAVQRWNGLRGTVIRVGARLRIFSAGGPAAPPATAAPGEQVTHVIRRGKRSRRSRGYTARPWPPCRGGMGCAGASSGRVDGSPSSVPFLAPSGQRACKG